MNLVDQFFPRRTKEEDQIADNLMMVMKYYGFTKQELDELPMPTYVELRDFAIRQMKEEQKAMKGIKMPKGRR